MRIAIVGYGRMGRETERLAGAAGHDIVARIDPHVAEADAGALSADIAAAADVAIEFGAAEAVVDNARRYAQYGLAAAVGTTGWGDRLDEVSTIVAGGGSGYLHASNFSLGVQLFLRLAARATALLDPFDDYDIAIFERHHRRKADSPSGTALTIANAVLGASSRKRRVATERLDRPIDADELHVASVRGGEEPGTHTLLWDSADDTIELTHRARGRANLAAGALRAAEWLSAGGGRRGMYGIDDLIDDMLA
ncbi:MAG: 4-hydroxy-tetrahydrodipicolinate reductase [Spirochaetaceae bacterium]|nr:4-hydroxy-tetrahydrodipicolinate reductase [Spirochaetaceae bacterium]